MFIQLKSKKRILEFLRDTFIEFVQSSCQAIGVFGFVLIQGEQTGQKMIDLIFKEPLTAISIILAGAILIIGLVIGEMLFWTLKKLALLLYKCYRKIVKRKLPY